MSSLDIESNSVLQPLSLFDDMHSHVSVVMGWLVEGDISLDKVERALNIVVKKWPMLAGRMEKSGEYQYFVRIPLGPLPEGYRPYVATKRTSDVPLSHHIPVPLPMASDPLPASIFMEEGTPQDTKEWIAKSLPLTYWHIRHFLGEKDYSCIGVTFSHGLFDGLGISHLIHAVEAELSGKEWTPPPPPSDQNILRVVLEKAMAAPVQSPPKEYHAAAVANVWVVVMFLFYHIWQQWWHNTCTRTILIPERAYMKMVEDARKTVALSGKDDVRLSVADVIAAFLFKTSFSVGAAPHKRVHLTNLASLRRFFDGRLNSYPHNCIVPMPGYPLLTAAELSATPIPDLAYQFALGRKGFSEADALEFYKVMQRSKEVKTACMPYDIRADENATQSNMTIARIVDIDWTGAGCGRTLCRWKTIANGMGINFTNIITVAGKLDDGTMVMDVVFNKKRLQRIEAEVERLISEAEL